jgi:hypothetical protein
MTSAKDKRVYYKHIYSPTIQLLDDITLFFTIIGVFLNHSVIACFNEIPVCRDMNIWTMMWGIAKERFFGTMKK